MNENQNDYARDNEMARIAQEKYDNYKKGVLSRNEWVTFLIESLDKYIYLVMRKSQRLQMYPGLKEDMYNESCIAILEQAEKYDPSRGSMTTFFHKFIMDAQRKVISKETPLVNDYYTNQEIKINKLVRNAGFSGIDDPNLDVRTISIITGLATRTIENTIENMKIQVVSIDKPNEDGDDLTNVISYSKSPEQVMIAKEKSEIVKGAIDNLNSFERYLISHYLNQTPLRIIMQELKEFGKTRFGDEFNCSIEQQSIQRATNAVINKLRNTRSIKSLDDKDEFVYLEDFEPQAEEEDIENFLALAL